MLAVKEGWAGHAWEGRGEVRRVFSGRGTRFLRAAAREVGARGGEVQAGKGGGEAVGGEVHAAGGGEAAAGREPAR